jgi:hypothetical protein
MPSRAGRRDWAASKRSILDGVDIVFLDPDNGLGSQTVKHATYSEVRALRRPGRAVSFITFPGRSARHDVLAARLHERLKSEAGVVNAITLRTNVSVPSKRGSGSYVQRQRWLTIVDADAEIVARLGAFRAALATVPRVRASLFLDAGHAR